MNSTKPFGLYLFQKSSNDVLALKDMLQYLKSTSPGKRHSFAYIEAETSLHPNLSLWENLQIETGPVTIKDYSENLKPDQVALIRLLKDMDKKTSEAEIWEKFIVSFIKGQINPAQNLLIDFNESILSPFIIQKMKQTIIQASDEKNILVASAHTALWLDCAHTLIERKDFEFETKSLDVQNLRKYWAS